MGEGGGVALARGALRQGVGLTIGLIVGRSDPNPGLTQGD